MPALEAELRAAEVGAFEPWLRLLPSVGVGGVGRATNEPGLSGDIASWSLFATATWVVYDGGARYAQARARAAEASELRFVLDERRRAAERDRREAELRRAAAARALVESEGLARIAAENAAETERLFEYGLATALERADAIASLYEAEAELARQRLALELSRLAVRRAEGRWPLASPRGRG